MFSNETRCIYRNNQLGEVICQLRFPEILSIGVQVPAAFQEEIRAEYPQYQARKELPAPKIHGGPNGFQLENQEQTVNYAFTSADGIYRVNLTSKFISLSCSKYTCWEDFAAHLDRPLAAFIRQYKPAYFERVGLRYVNFISRKDLDLEGIPFNQLIEPAYLGLLQEPDVTESAAARSSVDAEIAIHGGCKAKIHAGPGLVKRNNQTDSEVKFIFDQDLYMKGNIPVNMSAGALQTLHSQAFPIFRGAITDILHQAMKE